MTKPHAWKHGWADVYAYRNGAIADDFLSLVITPAIAALERRKHELENHDDPAIAAFSVGDHTILMSKTNTAFCLAIQSLFEQQIRSYLITCVETLQMVDVPILELENQSWGSRFDVLFFRVRGLLLTDFDSYARLTLLHQLGNVCRHGNGKSCRQLYHVHPELWPSYGPTASPVRASFNALTIPDALLSSFVDAIVLFWMDMERHGIESFWNGDEHLGREIERLKVERIRRL